MKPIGLIAGSGQFPIIFSKTARSKGFSIHAAAYVNEADPELARYVDTIEWLHLGQIKRLLKFFKKNDVSQAVMLGGITKTRMFTDVRPDTKAITLIAGMRHTHDDGLLRAFADFLYKSGIEIAASTFLLPELLAPDGCWTRRKPSRVQNRDLALGWKVAKEIGRLDIGQCVVVGGGSVLAIEAIDGTDVTIRRGGALGKGHAVAVKVCKPNQDMRFDVPAVGIETVRSMHVGGVRLLALEAGKTVAFDRQAMIGLADEYGISIVALNRA